MLNNIENILKCEKKQKVRKLLQMKLRQTFDWYMVVQTLLET